MSRLTLLLRGLFFHWRTNLAVVLGCIVGSSVLTGAFLVGDSMRGSLRAMTLQRLGDIDQAMIGAHFVTADLPKRLSALEDYSAVAKNVAGAIVVRGSTQSTDDHFAPRTTLIGTTPEFWSFYPSVGDNPELAQSVVVNEELARQLNVKAGDRLRVSLEKVSSIPREGLLGRRDAEYVLRQIPFTVDKVIPNTGAGRFGLESTQRVPANLFVPLADLAKAVEQEGRVNIVLLETAPGVDAAKTDEQLERAMTLADYGLTVNASEKFGYVWVESERKVLAPAMEKIVRAAAKELGVESQAVLSYLATTIRAGGDEIPYSVVTALETSDAPTLGPLPIQPDDAKLSQGSIALNQWTVDEGGLKAEVGDSVTLEFFVVDDRGVEELRSESFRLAGLVQMDGIALDQNYVPTYPGVTDAETLLSWDPPFPFDNDRVRKDVDEPYWDKYKTTPKAFVTLADGQRLWTTRFGDVTSIRFAPPAGVSAAEFVPTLREKLLQMLKPSAVELSFQEIRKESLAASSGSTDFGGLFIGFSFFLIVAAAMLVGLLFRLNVERRASQLGLLLAVGLGARFVKRLALTEGLILAATGSLIGLVGAFQYAQWMIDALTTWWQDAVNTPFVEFHWSVPSLLYGMVGSVAVSMIAVWWAVAGLSKVSVPRLLHRGFTFASTSLSGRGLLSWALAVLGLAGGLGLLGWSLTLSTDNVGAFFGGGALLLIGSLSLLSALLRRPPHEGVAGLGITKLGVRNGARYPARSVLTASLIASATFLVVAVGSMRHGEQSGEPKRDSGNGGYSLVGESSSPVHLHLDAPDAAFKLNISDETEELLKEATINHVRVRAGEDASCLNIYQPQNPTLLGVNKQFIQEGRFKFAALDETVPALTEAERSNPWLLLNRQFDDGATPAIGDANTLQWILKKPVGTTFEISDEAGEPIKVRIVASLTGSIFASELVVAEDRLLQHFPSVSGFRYFLIETDQAAALAPALQSDLADYGMYVQTTRERLAMYKAVENTYMGSFQTLGGLGLLLGTLGLGTVLLRNVMERRGELGLLRALGFRKASLGWLVLTETMFLLAAGLVIGTVTALLAVTPQLRDLQDYSALLPLAAILAAVFAAGVLSGLIAVFAALRTPLLNALRSE